jgi:hypothetical protein
VQYNLSLSFSILFRGNASFSAQVVQFIVPGNRVGSYQCLSLHRGQAIFVGSNRTPIRVLDLQG